MSSKVRLTLWEGSLKILKKRSSSNNNRTFIQSYLLSLIMFSKCYYQKRYLYIINGTLFFLKHSSNIFEMLLLV